MWAQAEQTKVHHIMISSAEFRARSTWVSSVQPAPPDQVAHERVQADVLVTHVHEHIVAAVERAVRHRSPGSSNVSTRFKIWDVPASFTLNSVSEGVVPLIEGLFTQGSRPGRIVNESVGGTFEMDSADWSNGIRYHVFDTRSDTEY